MLLFCRSIVPRKISDRWKSEDDQYYRSYKGIGDVEKGSKVWSYPSCHQNSAAGQKNHPILRNEQANRDGKDHQDDVAGQQIHFLKNSCGTSKLQILPRQVVDNHNQDCKRIGEIVF